jgi:hypothetical protein
VLAESAMSCGWYSSFCSSNLLSYGGGGGQGGMVGAYKPECCVLQSHQDPHYFQVSLSNTLNLTCFFIKEYKLTCDQGEGVI